MIEKVLGITGLFINPPDLAMVICVDRQSRIQALDRPQPHALIDLGGVEGYTHDYLCHGTKTLCGAIDVATGKGSAKPEARHQGFLTFLRLIDTEVPKDLDLHLVLDNHATHQHAAVEARLAERPRYHLHFTPTYSSWLNEVERWFGPLGEKALKRGGSRSVREVVEQVQALTDGRNSVEKSFAWVAAAQSILAKSERSSTSISDTVGWSHLRITGCYGKRNRSDAVEAHPRQAQVVYVLNRNSVVVYRLQFTD